MLHKYFKCDILINIVIGGFAKSKCPRNEIFTRCDAACQPSCARPVRKPFCIKVSSVIILKDVEYMLNI